MKKSSKKGLKIAAITVGCIALAVAAGFGTYRIKNRIDSKKYNLITLDTSSLPAPQEPVRDGFVQLKNVRMHYVIYGSGEQPLVLIHGNGGSAKSLAEAASYLANDYTVYVIESRCHGQSSDPGTIDYESMADDTAQFIAAMKLRKPYIMGHSDGGIIALTLATRYPDIPDAIISCGANTSPKTMKPYFIIGVKINNLFHHDKLNDMMLTLPDITAEMLGEITAPTYIVAGEHDIMWLSDTAYMYRKIPNSRIAIIKGAGHSTYMSHDGKQVAFQVPGKGIFTCNSDGSGVAYLCKGSHPAWLPDNSLIYTVVTDNGESFTGSDIYAVDVATGKAVLLTANTDMIPLTPAVTRDGKRVAFENAKDACIYEITLKY